MYVKIEFLKFYNFKKFFSFFDFFQTKIIIEKNLKFQKSQKLRTAARAHVMIKFFSQIFEHAFQVLPEFFISHKNEYSWRYALFRDLH